MAKRSQEWLDEFGDILPDEEETRELILDGSIEICPECYELSAYAFGDTTAYDEFEDGIIPGGFEPDSGTIARIGLASCWEWTCGHCDAHCVESSSPLNHPCYTHEDIDDEIDDDEF